MKYCFGVDVGGTSIKIGLFTTEGELIVKWEIPTDKSDQSEAILPDIAASLRNKIREKEISADEIVGIGIGVPAPVIEGGIIATQVTNLGWGYKDVKGELEEMTGLPVRAGNDANVAALGEMWLGAGNGEKNMVMVTLGTGVGGGAILNGRLIEGANGACAEIGHICVNTEETDHCGCGKTGCMEQYASATGIARIGRERLAEDEAPSVLRGQEITAKAVFDALKRGDCVAEEIVEKFGYYLGHGLANIAAVLDPKVIVIGGGVSKAGEIMIPYIKKYFLANAFFANRETEFRIAKLDNDAGICGAAKLILDR